MPALRIRSILVPIDFSPHSARAVELALDLAASFGARVHLLHSCDLPRRLVTVYDVVFPEQLEREIYGAAQGKLDTLLAHGRERGVEVEGELTMEAPSDAILRRARELSADAIVMGTRGLGRLRGALLGSVAERIIRSAPCPVMTVHADDL
jgi:nucleotide-binding universal stress UspA family protein